MTDERQKVAPAGQIRAPYEAPRVIIYGTLHELTRAIGSKSNLDGGKGTKKRSQ